MYFSAFRTRRTRSARPRRRWAPRPLRSLGPPLARQPARRSSLEGGSMATKSKVNVDLNSVLEHAASQFRGLNPNEPGQWPILPKVATFAALAVGVVVLGWFLVLQSTTEELDA